MKRRLAGLRGQLVVWYLVVLAVLLIGLGIVQSVALTRYLRAGTSESMWDSARAELGVLGPCFIRSSSDLTHDAHRLAHLLGSGTTGVEIVNPAGQLLASHGLGEPGSIRQLRLSSATVGRLIESTHPQQTVSLTSPPSFSCPPAPHHGFFFRPRHEPVAVTAGNNLLLIAVPLESGGTVVGYAIMGRSLDDATRTVQLVQLTFGLGALVALLIAALIALPIINRALQPLRRVAGTAEAIAGGDLSKRANLASSTDEIGRLGQAFDTMVDRLEEALLTATDSEARMRRFLADASHELRTPLTAVRGTAEVLLRQGPSGRPEVDRALTAMHEEAVRLSRLVDDLLTLSRLDAGETTTPQPVEVGPFLAGFLERYAPVWPARAFDVQQDSGTAVAVVDPDALTRVLTNLVDNAAKYSRAQGRIELGARREGDTVAVWVRDEGPGLAPEDAERVFQRFYRVNKSRSRQSGGTGLGLSIVRALTERSGGRIDLDTAPDRGTIVTLHLPAA